MAASSGSHQDEPNFPIFMIYSPWSLDDICDFLRQNGLDSDRIGPVRIDRFQGKETDRTICLFDRSIYNRLIKEGYSPGGNHDFSISYYQLRDSNFPQKNESRNLFIRLPDKLSGGECRHQLSVKMNNLAIFEIISNDHFQVKLTLKSRESDQHTGMAFITFDKEIKINVIAMIKLIIHDSHWNIDEESWELVECFWARDHPHNHSPSNPEQVKKSSKKTKSHQPIPHSNYSIVKDLNPLEGIRLDANPFQVLAPDSPSPPTSPSVPSVSLPLASPLPSSPSVPSVSLPLAFPHE